MQPEYITPFISSIQNVFGTMLQLPVQIGEPSIKNSPTTSYDVSGIIGMSGDVTGSVVLSFPLEAAERMVSLFCGMELPSDSPDFPDAIGELVNMVSGGAKAQFDGKTVSITTPSVVIGANHRINVPSDTPVIVIPCQTDCGEVALEIAIKESPVAASADAGATDAAAQASN